METKYTHTQDQKDTSENSLKKVRKESLKSLTPTRHIERKRDSGRQRTNYLTWLCNGWRNIVLGKEKKTLLMTAMDRRFWISQIVHVFNGHGTQQNSNCLNAQMHVDGQIQIDVSILDILLGTMPDLFILLIECQALRNQDFCQKIPIIVHQTDLHGHLILHGQQICNEDVRSFYSVSHLQTERLSWWE